MFIGFDILIRLWFIIAIFAYNYLLTTVVIGRFPRSECKRWLTSGRFYLFIHFFSVACMTCLLPFTGSPINASNRYGKFHMCNRYVQYYRCTCRPLEKHVWFLILNGCTYAFYTKLRLLTYVLSPEKTLGI